MKLAIVVLLWVGVGLAYGQGAPSSHDGDERSIRQLNVDVLKAYNLGDVKTLDRIEDADFTLSGEFGEVAKAKQIDSVSHRPPNTDGVNVMVENGRFRFYGDAALLTEVERYGEGKDFPRFESTSLWVRRGGDWKLVHLHFSKLTD